MDLKREDYEWILSARARRAASKGYPSSVIVIWIITVVWCAIAFSGVISIFPQDDKPLCETVFLGVLLLNLSIGYVMVGKRNLAAEKLAKKYIQEELGEEKKD